MKILMQQQMKEMSILILLLFAGVVSGFAQSLTVEGKVQDQQSKPIANANVFIKGTIDGATSDSLGNFSFTTNQRGEITLYARMIGYAELTMQVLVKNSTALVLIMIVVIVNLLANMIRRYFNRKVNLK